MRVWPLEIKFPINSDINHQTDVSNFTHSRDDNFWPKFLQMQFVFSLMTSYLVYKAPAVYTSGIYLKRTVIQLGVANFL